MPIAGGVTKWAFNVFFSFGFTRFVSFALHFLALDDIPSILWLLERLVAGLFLSVVNIFSQRYPISHSFLFDF